METSVISKHKKDAIYIPSHTVKWVAVILVSLNLFTFTLGLVAAPTLADILGSSDAVDGEPAGRAQLEDVDAFSLGREDAPVTIVEFSDFQCPFCRRAALDTLPDIQKNYIDTGKVRLEYRHFPLSFHPAAPHASEAFECAREQNKAWEVHDIIYAKQALQGVGTVTFTDADVKQWVAEVPGLDAAAVATCMDSDQYVARVRSDLNDGAAAGVTGTPAFFIGNYDDGFILLVGAQPFGAFEQIIEQELG